MRTEPPSRRTCELTCGDPRFVGAPQVQFAPMSAGGEPSPRKPAHKAPSRRGPRSTATPPYLVLVGLALVLASIGYYYFESRPLTSANSGIATSGSAATRV